MGGGYGVEEERIPPPDINTSGNWVFEFTGLKTGDRVLSATIEVFAKKAANVPGDATLIATGTKPNVDIRIP